MALMYKCDRCGKVYDPHEKKKDIPTYDLKRSEPDGMFAWSKQLCPECTRSLHDWFENPNRIYCPFNCICSDSRIVLTDISHKKKRWWQK